MSAKPNKLAISSRTKKLLEISKNITKDELRTLKILCSEHIPAGELENLTTALELFKKIEEIDANNDNGDSFLSHLFDLIGRKDLCRKLSGLPVEGTDHTQRQKSKIPTDVKLLVSEKVAADWKRLGRYLEVEEYVIDRIDGDFRKLLDKSFELLKEWEKRNDEACVEILANCLKEMGRRDICSAIEKLKDHYSSPPVQETYGPEVQEASNSAANIIHDGVQTSSTNFSQQSLQKNGGSKYHVSTSGGVTLVGDFSSLIIQDGAVASVCSPSMPPLNSTSIHQVLQVNTTTSNQVPSISRPSTLATGSAAEHEIHQSQVEPTNPESDKSREKTFKETDI